ncbi:lysM domain receptor-like kinase 3 [Mangifera indica]|uniref:lysM domain receptor-like kinase 3 n=1 Tax=Mangifera indica TaxID=29780 RepID=UPI001CFB83D2|nr:lysM domain receptor-like kinase 3 [Mangifera indica]
MCKSKKATSAIDPTATRPTHLPQTCGTQSPRAPPNFSYASTSSTSSSSFQHKASSSGLSFSSRTSLSSLRESISESTHIYSFSEIRAATNNFLLKKHSSSSSNGWRCNLRGRDVIIFQRKFRLKLQIQHLKERLSVICRSHHNSIIKLRGAAISDDYISLVYEFINGLNLSDCLRNSKNPDFTVLSTWMSRMQIATDLAHGLDYIHNNTGLNLTLVHNHIKSSSIIVMEPSFNAKICHFGTAQLCGESEEEYVRRDKVTEIQEIIEEEPVAFLTRSRSSKMQFEGVRGYISPEFRVTGIPTQKSDVYSLGVVILELLSGEEPFKYKFDNTRGELVRTSVTETARLTMDGGDDGCGREGNIRKWIDRRLKDSFPIDVAEKLIRVALECVDDDPAKRPDMGRVSRKISKLYLESRVWADHFKTDISCSLGPR